MYILVEIIHTEFQYISLIEMQKYNWNRKRIEKRKTWKKRDLLSHLVTPTRTKGCASHVGAGCTFCPGWCYQPGQKVLFCSGCHTRDKRAPPFVPDWRSRLGNRDNSGFPTGTNQRFCSSVEVHRLPSSPSTVFARVCRMLQANVSRVSEQCCKYFMRVLQN